MTASTDASFVCTTDSASVYRRAATHDSTGQHSTGLQTDCPDITHDSVQPSTGLQTDHPDIAHDRLRRDHADSQGDQPDLTHAEWDEDMVMQIAGTVHWFLEGWIGDHSVDFLVDSGSSVTAMSNSFYRTLIQAGAPLGILGLTARTLRGANGTHIGVPGCSNCVVSFLGLQVEFRFLCATWRSVPMPLLEQTSWAPCCLTPCTLKTASSLPKGALLFNCTAETLLCLVVCLRLYYTVLSGLPVVAVCHPVDC